jgi:hypothetical protein
MKYTARSIGLGNRWDNLEGKELKEAVQKEYEASDEDFKGVRILVASYGYESYEGESFVMFLKDRRLNVVFAGHCSCYGLEGRWEPEKVSINAMRNLLETRSYTFAGGREVVAEVINQLEKCRI